GQAELLGPQLEAQPAPDRRARGGVREGGGAGLEVEERLAPRGAMSPVEPVGVDLQRELPRGSGGVEADVLHEVLARAEEPARLGREHVVQVGPLAVARAGPVAEVDARAARVPTLRPAPLPQRLGALRQLACEPGGAVA